MAIPFYNQGDQDIYAGGEHFIPQEQYRLNYTAPSIMGQNTNTGLASTNIAQPYKPPYIWPPQGGGGGGGPDDDDATGYSSLGLSPGALGGKLPGIGNWAKRTVGNLGHIYSNLPLPSNIIRKGIETYKDWKEEKEAEKARISTVTRKRAIDKLKEKYDEDPDSIGIPTGGGADVGDGKTGDGNQGGDAGGAMLGSGMTTGQHAAFRKAQGGRIGFKDGLSAYQLFKLKELGYPGAGSNPGSYGGLGVLRDILKLHKYKHGGRIGYQNGEFVEDVNVEGPGYDENIEEVQGEPSREQLEAIALEIFQLPLEQLDEEQLMIVYQAAMEQEPSEEEVQFAAEGPGEGIASLV